MNHRLFAPLLGYLGWIMLALSAACRPSTSSPPSSSQTMPAIHEDHLSLDDPRLQWWGRFACNPDGVRRAAWTASQLVFRCEAESVTLTAGHEPLPGDPTPWPLYLQVQVDSLAPNVIAIPPQSRDLPLTLAEPLAHGVHTIRVIKRSEARTGIWRIEGLSLSADGKLLAPPPSPLHHLEVIGNSITCGYGNLGTEAECDFSAQSEDGTQSYAAIAARQFGATYTAVAYSGRGIWRNYDGSKTGTLWDLYRQTFPGDTSLLTQPPTDTPEVVVINLGTNDFAMGIPHRDTFVAQYEKLGRYLFERYPEVALVLLSGPMLSDAAPRRALSTLRSYLDDVQARLAEQGLARVHRFDLTPQGQLGYGCAWHPSLAQHRLNGAELADFLQHTFGWEPVVNKTTQD